MSLKRSFAQQDEVGRFGVYEVTGPGWWDRCSRHVQAIPCPSLEAAPACGRRDGRHLHGSLGFGALRPEIADGGIKAARLLPASLMRPHLSRIRVRPVSSLAIAEFPQHKANGRELQESERVMSAVLKVLGQAAAPVEPSEGAFDYPSAGQHDEALADIGTFDDFDFYLREVCGSALREPGSLVATIGEHLAEEWE